MARFALTAEQETYLFSDIIELIAEGGAIFAQIYEGEKGNFFCRAHHINKKDTEKIWEILRRD